MDKTGLRELGLLHAERMAKDYERMRDLLSTENRRALAEFGKLLELAAEAVSAHDDVVFEKLSELESFLR